MNDIGQLLSWRGLLRIVPVYLVLTGIYNFGLSGEGLDNWQDLVVSTLVMTAILSAGTLLVVLIVNIGNRGGLATLQAQRALSSGNRSEALRLYDDALKDNPKRAEALVARAEILVDLGRNTDARADLDQAIAVTPHVINFPNPLLFRAYITRGRLREAAGDRNGAVNDWAQATRTSPGSPDPYILRGRAALEAGDWLGGQRLLRQGVDILTRRLRVNQQNVAPSAIAAQLNLRGLAYNLLGDYRPALADFEQSLTLEPNSWSTHFNLGATYLNMGHVEQALSELDSAVKINPGAGVAARNSKSYASLVGNPDFEAIAGGGRVQV